MGEPVRRLAFDDTRRNQISKVAIKGNLSQADDNSQPRQLAKLSCQVHGTVANLLRRGFISGGSAANNRGDPGVAETKAIVA